MNILVTGGLGHIGSRLIRDLAADKDIGRIRIFDNLSTQRYASLFNLPAGGAYEFMEGDVLKPEQLEPAMQDIEVVVHLAAITNAEGSFAIKDAVQQVNLGGTQRVLEAARRAGVRQVIFPSTTSVYGPHSEVVREDCGPEELRPQSPYAESKLQAEEAVLSAGRSGALHGCVFRFGTIFGPSPGMRFHTAVNRFVFQACLGQPLTVWEWALQQQRPYLDLGDAVAAIHFALRAPDRVANELFNVVTLNATVQQIIDAIRQHVPDLTIRLTQTAILNQQSYVVDSAKFQSQGFAYHGDLSRGLTDTIALLRGVLAGRGRAATEPVAGPRR